MSKSPKELYESGEIKEKQGDSRSCAECGKPVEKYLWSPLFCPECDIKRMERIDKGMKNISEKMESIIKESD